MLDQRLDALFFERMQNRPDRTFLRVYGAQRGDERERTRRDVAESVCAAAAYLRAVGAQPGVPVGCFVRDPEHFFILFWACRVIAAPFAPIPIPQASVTRWSKSEVETIEAIIGLSAPSVIVADAEFIEGFNFDGGVNVRPWDQAHESNSTHTSVESANHHNEVAVMQFTSGSTASPKACLISDNALLANFSMCSETLKIQADDVGVVWTPLFHDMGLMTGIVAPVIADGSAILIDTRRFIRDPLIWLNALSQCARAHTSSSSWGLSLATRRLAARGAEGLDLSGITSLICGAEPISLQTLREFLAVAGPYGASSGQLRCAYGLAEATLMVTCHRGGLEEATPKGIEGCTDVVCLGEPAPGVEMRIVNEAGLPSPEGVAGHVQIKSPALALGYLTANGFEAFNPDAWFETGDIGFLKKSRFHFVGRRKSIAKIAGRPVYLDQIEEVVACKLDIPKRRLAAFSLVDEDGHECLGFALECREADQTDSLSRELQLAVFEASRVTSKIVFLKPGGLPRTTSGKIRRHLVAQIAGEIACLS